MKKVLLLFTTISLITGGTIFNNHARAKEVDRYNCQVGTTVYVCTGPNSKRYHKYHSCKGLKRCSGSIRETSRERARAIGRTPCKWCYK